MTLEQLRIFVAVAERLNMTRAAEALHLTQSAVSAAINALETRHATRLFDRVGRGLALTEAGIAFLPAARAVLSQAQAASLTLEDLGGLKRGALKIAASQTVATYWLPIRLAQFAHAHPGIKIELCAMNSAMAAAAVVAGEADFGVVEGRAVDPALKRFVVGGDRIGLYAGADCTFGDQSVDVAALKNISWALREAGSGTRDHFETAMAKCGLDPQDLDIRLELPSNGAVLSIVEAGGLVTAVSDLAGAPRLAAGRVSRLAFELEPRAFTLITHAERHHSRATTAFLTEQCGVSLETTV